MKKVWTFFQTFILGAIEGPALVQEDIWLDAFFDKCYEKDPKNTAALISALYPLIDTVGEDLVAKTNNTYDDHQVALVKKDLEDFATAKGFTLSNVDAD